MVEQLTHNTALRQEEKFPLVLVCDGVNGPANVGGIFRLSDAFGVSEIIFTDANINFSSGRLKRTSRNTTEKTACKVVNSIASEIARLRSEGFRVIGLELTTSSIPVENLKCTTGGKIALIIGGENHGISNEVLQELDAIIHITMYGKNSSMNVVQATGIALYQILLKLKY